MYEICCFFDSINVLLQEAKILFSYFWLQYIITKKSNEQLSAISDYDFTYLDILNTMLPCLLKMVLKIQKPFTNSWKFHERKTKGKILRKRMGNICTLNYLSSWVKLEQECIFKSNKMFKKKTICSLPYFKTNSVSYKIIGSTYIKRYLLYKLLKSY